MYSGEGEYVPFVEPVDCGGEIENGKEEEEENSSSSVPVEVWMARLVAAMRATMADDFRRGVSSYDDSAPPPARTAWILGHCAQTAATVSRAYYAAAVGAAFRDAEAGDDGALAAELARQRAQLADLIAAVAKPDLSANDRRKLITLCTIDVHARDVLAALVEERGSSADCFRWASQLRYYSSGSSSSSSSAGAGGATSAGGGGDCLVRICDAEVAYGYEYIGNCGCLCITPLTDRCYITLTQAQRLVLGGAPAGPAGTGKTETTKDLARALGFQCYVFNCSDQMDYRAMGTIYRGLAQTGAWGCFDEFNRISVSVLSVCSTQYKSVLDALRAKAETFVFEGVETKLKPNAMAFITMNPGYAGRAELPESLKVIRTGGGREKKEEKKRVDFFLFRARLGDKLNPKKKLIPPPSLHLHSFLFQALFRPVSMCVPDLALICEVMLMAEGFQRSRELARKFVGLYRLCEGMLSKARHYDWKLRAIKTTLSVAGAMKRSSPPGASEEKVLLRALRDFNVGKLTGGDAPVFAGLLEDLFPGLPATVPRAADVRFEAAAASAAVALGYVPERRFLLKVSQLREIFTVRWSVFLLGPPGSGKTAVWRTLAAAQRAMGEATDVAVLNPKAVTRDELYGCFAAAASGGGGGGNGGGEWKDCLLSRAFRDFATDRTKQHQWLVLDGDIDPEWIESMNTVMDDNRVLTLASNERIPLAPPMRLLLEIESMAHCSPATVSRGGVVFVNGDEGGGGGGGGNGESGESVFRFSASLFLFLFSHGTHSRP